ncbi:polymer-forming cytoskeletal protein, partial [Myxococcota bacterium]
MLSSAFAVIIEKKTNVDTWSAPSHKVMPMEVEMTDVACLISNGIQVRGSLSGSGDLVVQGRMEGHIVLEAHVTVEENGTVVADVETQELTVHGRVSGNTDATERISIS